MSRLYCPWLASAEGRWILQHGREAEETDGDSIAVGFDAFGEELTHMTSGVPSSVPVQSENPTRSLSVDAGFSRRSNIGATGEELEVLDVLPVREGNTRRLRSHTISSTYQPPQLSPVPLAIDLGSPVADKSGADGHQFSNRECRTVEI